MRKLLLAMLFLASVAAPALAASWPPFPSEMTGRWCLSPTKTESAYDWSYYERERGHCPDRDLLYLHRNGDIDAYASEFCKLMPKGHMRGWLQYKCTYPDSTIVFHIKWLIDTSTAQLLRGNLQASAANAQPPCYVADPTSTPLNVRGTPNGSILGALHNGIRVNIVARRGDWVRIVTERGDGKSGWVYLDYLDCTL
jgi:hypothetical protein